nr:methyl-accepting chemotaxis protein [uncultured Massilia sp.]
MNILMNLKIGTRLALGFAVVLGLSILSTVVGIVKLNAVADAAQEMMNEPIRKERLASDWSKNTNLSVTRTSAIIKSSDPALVEFFAKSTQETNRTTAAYLKELEPLLTSAQEKEAYARATGVRDAYQSSRNQALKLKAEGRIEESSAVLEKSYLPAAEVYQGSITELLKLQRTRLDSLKVRIDDLRDSSRNLVVLLAALSVVLSAICAWWLTLSIVRPVKDAVDVAQRVAAGDLTADPQVHGRDEIGQLQTALKHMNGQLLRIVRDIRGGSDAIATASSEIAAGNQDLSSRTEQQAGSLEETASSMEELTSTVTQNADNARQATVLAQTASSVAGRGGEVVAEVVRTMVSIDASSKKIADIIGTIDGIAFQTNILALNAAVEAARAGEQGRGFAVVAGEVRNLAHRSAAAAKEIKDLIGDSVDKVESGTKLVNQAGVTMEEIVGSVQRVTDIIGEIASATDEQRSGIGQINQAIAQMDQVTQQNASLVEEAAAASEAMQQQAQDLARVVSVFKINDDGRASVRASRSAAGAGKALVARLA